MGTYFRALVAVIFSALGSVSVAEQSLTAYFSNDSMNGFQLSDAYETHNMGLRFNSGSVLAEIDLGILSPDMHMYKNEYRVANRSYGEVITLSLGQSFDISSDINVQGGLYYKAVGEFGLDRAQNFLHDLFGLQDVQKLNDSVRMPNSKHFGVSASLTWDLGDQFYPIERVTSAGYLGTDKASIHSSLASDWQIPFFDAATTTIGLNFTVFDELVSAPPVSAPHRKLIPSAELRLFKRLYGLDFFVSEKIQLPTIRSDNSVYAIFSAGVKIPLN